MTENIHNVSLVLLIRCGRLLELNSILVNVLKSRLKNITVICRKSMEHIISVLNLFCRIFLRLYHFKLYGIAK